MQLAVTRLTDTMSRDSDQDPLVELSRAGSDPLEFRLSEISPQTVANVFHVSNISTNGKGAAKYP